MSVSLSEHQLKAVEELKNGSILCGGVGSGKSRTAIAYYMFKICDGGARVNGVGMVYDMKQPRDLYIITTAKKRDSLEWDEECSKYLLFRKGGSLSGVNVVVDSWNNIKKYRDVVGAFFIFDEQRVVGSGSWVKSFLDITRKNKWILLSATPGDSWKDYIPVFVANGFFRNRTEFNRMHVVFSKYAKFPKIEKYLGEKRLEKLRDEILVTMNDDRETVRHVEYVDVDYNIDDYKIIMKNRWDIYDNKPIEESGKLLYLLRRVCFSDHSRIEALDKIVSEKQRVIVFYNFNYELDMLREYAQNHGIKYKEWNGQKHQEMPKGDRWLYLVQYLAGSEGWNCITTDTIVFFSQTYSYKTLEQASGRIDRMNTPFKDLYYYHLCSKSPIDKAINLTLRQKKNFNEKAFIKRYRL